MLAVPLLIVPFQRFDRPQFGFPVSFEVACHQSVVRFDRIVLPVRPLRLEAGSLQPKSPLLLQSSGLIFQVRECVERQGQLIRFQGLQDQLLDGRIDSGGVDLLAAWRPDFTSLLIAHIAGLSARGAPIANPQPGPTATTEGDPLQ